MGFDDLFEDKRRRYGNYREHGYHDDYDDHDHHHNERYSLGSYPAYRGHHDHQKWLTVLDKIRNNKKLKFIVIAATVLILTLAIGLIIALLPLLIKIFHYVSQNGLQSILDGVTGFLDKLWKGSGK